MVICHLSLVKAKKDSENFLPLVCTTLQCPRERKDSTPAPQEKIPKCGCSSCIQPCYPLGNTPHAQTTQSAYFSSCVYHFKKSNSKKLDTGAWHILQMLISCRISGKNSLSIAEMQNHLAYGRVGCFSEDGQSISDPLRAHQILRTKFLGE